MRSRRFLSHLSTATLVTLLATGCDDPAAVVQPDEGAVLNQGAHIANTMKGAQRSYQAHGDLLKAVRTATARFNSTTQAIRAGYTPTVHCVADPEYGGMGYHWVNLALVNPTFDPLQPEALLYAPGPGGNLRLVGVEYIVVNRGQPWPQFAGYDFDEGGSPPLTAQGIPHWTLHVWLYEDNPLGIFEPYNPNVSCP